MRIRYIQDEDFVNYKKPSMFISMAFCSFKCEKECGVKGLCQNSDLVNFPLIEVDNNKLIAMFEKNTLVSSIVLGGLEPFDQFDEICQFISVFRQKHNDDIVIYTGYKEEEIVEEVNTLKSYKNIVIKFGRFIPNQENHFDETLGVNLASSNQYARRIS